MNLTQPITDLETINKIGVYLKNQNMRDYILFRCMLYLALRTQDIIDLKVGDVKGKNRIVVKETKTRKRKYVDINPDLLKELADYTEFKGDDEPLFPSVRTKKALSRAQAFRSLQKAGQAIGMESLSGHVLRKTFCYHAYMNGTPLSVLCELLNHSSEAVTRKYIGLRQEDIKEAYYSVSF